MEVETEFVCGSCNLTYNCIELSSDLIFYATHHALVIYDILDEKVVKTVVKHGSPITSLRFVKNSFEKFILTTGTNGQIVLWENHHLTQKYLIDEKLSINYENESVLVADGIIKNSILTVCYVSKSKLVICNWDAINETGALEKVEEINLGAEIALDVNFHILANGDLLLAAGLSSGEVFLFSPVDKSADKFTKLCTLKKHEDWVRCLAITSLENGESLLASGGQDSLIAIWRFSSQNQLKIDEKTENFNENDYEFQVQNFGNHKIFFDSLIIGHEGWINSLAFNSSGELVSCSSDQSIIIWENKEEIWSEKTRLGVVGGLTPGPFSTKFNTHLLISATFQGAIQIWTYEDEDWKLRPSITGHFKSVSDLDFHSNGKILLSTSLDQTTRIFSKNSNNNWHENNRPQIHGHDIFTAVFSSNYIISGAEEKILRVFEPPADFFENLTKEPKNGPKNKVNGAILPTLGLSNQRPQKNPTANQNQGEKISTNEDKDEIFSANESEEELLDEDFLRSNTLWAEISKLYGHVYEICTIAACSLKNICVSAANSTKPAHSGIFLWDLENFKEIGIFYHHKLNVTNMEFSTDGNFLLSVSRDRTWAVWKVLEISGNIKNFKENSINLENDKICKDSIQLTRPKFELILVQSSDFHTRALNVGIWGKCGNFFVTGARDKKLAIWGESNLNTEKFDEKDEILPKNTYEKKVVNIFESSVTAAAINNENILGVGLENGLIHIFKLEILDDSFSLNFLHLIDNSMGHHDMVKKLKFNPQDDSQLASCGSDHFVKIFRIAQKN